MHKHFRIMKMIMLSFDLCIPSRKIHLLDFSESQWMMNLCIIAWWLNPVLQFNKGNSFGVVNQLNSCATRWKVLLRDYKSLWKRFCRQHLATLATLTILRPSSSEFPDGAILQTIAGLWIFRPLLPHPSTMLTKHELGLPFPPRNLRIKFGANPSTIFLVIVVTDRHTDTHTHTQTNAGENIFPRFRGDNKSYW